MNTRQVKLIGKKEFAAAALEPEYKVFVVHIAVLSINLGDEVHPSKKAQIAHLKVDKALSKLPSEYTDFVDVFSLKFAAELLEHIEINNHAIELVDNQQALYDPIQ